MVLIFKNGLPIMHDSGGFSFLIGVGVPRMLTL
jgi:hypothetical protein